MDKYLCSDYFVIFYTKKQIGLRLKLGIFAKQFSDWFVSTTRPLVRNNLPYHITKRGVLEICYLITSNR